MIIPLYRKGAVIAVTAVDEEDAHLSKYTWRLPGRYAVRSAYLDGKGISLSASIA